MSGSIVIYQYEDRYVFVGLADVAPVKRSVPDISSDVGCCPFSCIRQWSTMGIICQLNFTISTISKADGRWDWADFSKSWTLPTMEADIVTCLPRLTVEFPQLIDNFQFNERTNERYDYCSNCLYFLYTSLYSSCCFERDGSDRLKKAH